MDLNAKNIFNDVQDKINQATNKIVQILVENNTIDVKQFIKENPRFLGYEQALRKRLDDAAPFVTNMYDAVYDINLRYAIIDDPEKSTIIERNVINSYDVYDKLIGRQDQELLEDFIKTNMTIVSDNTVTITLPVDKPITIGDKTFHPVYIAREIVHSNLTTNVNLPVIDQGTIIRIKITN